MTRSLQENDFTVLSIFVNPAQFAPHEDLATYPRTLPADLAVLSAQAVHVLSTPNSSAPEGQTRTPSAVFLPSVPEMYPSGITQQRDAQRGTFVEVAGYGAAMEGAARPGFFRGVATVVTKLFNAVQPTRAYFGQKDIQQALLLRRMCGDMLMAYPGPRSVRIVETERGPSGLALSSRNAYLSPAEQPHATVLYRALEAAQSAWNAGKPKHICIKEALEAVEHARKEAEKEGVKIKMDYVQMNGAREFDVLDDAAVKGAPGGEGAERDDVLLSGAVWVGKTRLIDNFLLGDVKRILG